MRFRCDYCVIFAIKGDLGCNPCDPANTKASGEYPQGKLGGIVLGLKHSLLLYIKVPS